ncbi:MAG: RIP metalloprotease RseP [Synergistaceae bacterium]|nr:RIP metalloprotease RseP [Synergistaceae bacterium]
MLASIVAFIIVIAVCVIVHEYGHYITAKILGVQVHEFAFGMGPVILQHRNEKTNMLWSWRLFPVGGFCRLAGMDEEEDDEEVIAGKGFNEQPSWKRFLILLNGSLFNILLAVLLMAAFLYGHGVLDMEHSKIGELMPGFPAESAGIKVGDEIVKVNESEIKQWRDISETIRQEVTKNPNQDINLEVRRGEEILKFSVNVPVNKEYGRPMLGVSPSHVRYGLYRSLRSAAGYTYKMSVLMMRGLYDLLTGQQEADVTGPVGIASMSGRAMKSGFWDFISFIAIIALNLGILNLFPIPALDGGRLLFVMLEIIVRRRLPDKIENWIHTAGFVLLISLMIFITCKDVYNLFFTH